MVLLGLRTCKQVMGLLSGYKQMPSVLCSLQSTRVPVSQTGQGQTKADFNRNPAPARGKCHSSARSLQPAPRNRTSLVLLNRGHTQTPTPNYPIPPFGTPSFNVKRKANKKPHHFQIGSKFQKS